jgi:hypothetical protein
MQRADQRQQPERLLPEAQEQAPALSGRVDRNHERAQGISMATVMMKSQLSGKTSSREIPVDQAELDNWLATPRRERRHVQYQFPFLSADDREFLMTGITPEEWNETFGGDDDGE